jgi:hypothetical protein
MLLLCANIPKAQKDTKIFTILGSGLVKALHKHVGEIDPRCQFQQHFM